MTPAVAWRAERCPAGRFVRASCSRCVEACPRAAIVRDAAGVRVLEACDGCGLCAAACPSGALDPPASATPELTNRAMERARSGRVAYRCERADPEPGAIGVPCAGRLDEVLLTAPLLAGATSVHVEIGECARCARGAAFSRTFPARLRFARALLTAAGRPAAEISVVSRPRRPGSFDARRRALFTSLFGGAAQSLRAAAEDPGSGGDSPVGASRRAELIRRLRDAVPAPRAAERAVPPHGAPVAIPSIDGRCTGCNVCSVLCPTAAIERTETPDAIELRVDPSLCTACGACAEACLTGAISVRPAAGVGHLFAADGGSTIVVARCECAACGIEFGTSGDDRCPRCRRTGSPSALSVSAAAAGRS